MSAHHVKHASGCPCYGDLSRSLADCTCSAPGSAKAKANRLAMTPAEVVDAVEDAATNPNLRRDTLRARRRALHGYVDAAGNVTTSGGVPVGAVDDPVLPEHAYQLADIVYAIESLLGRRIGLDEHIDAERSTFYARHRCHVCRADLESRVAVSIEAKREAKDVLMLIVAEVGIAVRKSLAKHRCDPVERSFRDFTADELNALYEQLERDGTAMIARAAEILTLARTR